MKIIAASNFDDECFNEYVIAENIETEYLAQIMCDALNDKFCNRYSDIFYRVKSDNYKLQEFEP